MQTPATRAARMGGVPRQVHLFTAAELKKGCLTKAAVNARNFCWLGRNSIAATPRRSDGVTSYDLGR